MDTNEVNLTPVENHCNGIKKMKIDGEAQVVCTPETKRGLTTDDRSPRHLIDGSCRATAADRVDKASRFLFPVFFVIYNIVYWAVYALPEKKPE